MLMIILYSVIVLVISFILFYKFIFLRDAERTIPKGNNIVSPADGKIIEIIDIKKKTKIRFKGESINIKKTISDTLKDGYLISIFMSIFNVHINRSPVKGKITKTKYTKGKFLPANTLKVLENEKNEIIIENKKLGKIKVIQIAGLIARRIICSINKNQNIDKGQRIGLIKLGSNVILIIPKLKLKVKKGQKVKAGSSIIAEY